MKIAIRSLLVVVSLGLLGYLGWPELHTRLIMYRVRLCTERTPMLGNTTRLPSASFIYFESFDPPNLILEALWRVVISPDSTPLERDDAALALTHLTWSGDYESFRRPDETPDDWHQASADFFRRWTADPAPGNGTLTLGFHKLEADWRKAHP